MIGIFDSGFGGLTVMRKIIELLPHESIVYLGDTAHLPYGNKSPNTIIHYALENAKFLLKQKIDLLIVACHTASSFALERLQKELPIPVFGIIDAGCEELLATAKKRIAILGTSATISSSIYPNKLAKANIEVVSRACPLLVSLVEEGFLEGEITKLTIKHYLSDLKPNIEAALLACTHFPLLQKAIQRELGEKVKVIDPATALAKKIKFFSNHSANAKPHYRYFVTDNPKKFKIMAEQLLNLKIDVVEEKLA